MLKTFSEVIEPDKKLLKLYEKLPGYYPLQCCEFETDGSPGELFPGKTILPIETFKKYKKDMMKQNEAVLKEIAKYTANKKKA